MRFVFFFLLLFAGSAGFSQKADPSQVFRNRFKISSWTSADGLSNSKVNAVLSDKSGFIWVATQRGLFRFDGTIFHKITSPKYPLLGNSTFLALAQDKRGIIWAGSMESGLLRIDNDSLRFYTKEADGLPSNLQKSIAVDSSGTIWAAAYHGGITRIDGDTITAVFDKKEGLLDNSTWTIVSDAPGKLWVGTNSGLYRFENNVFTKSSAALGLNNPIIRALFVDADSSVWVGTDGGGLTQIKKDQSVLQINSTVGLQNDFILGIKRKSDGLWLGTYGAGIIVYTGVNAIPMSKYSGLSNNFVFDMAFGPDESVWVATDDGLNAILPRKVSWITTDDGLNEEQLFGIFQDSKGRIWASPNGGGAQYLENGTWKTVTENQGLPIRFIYGFHEDLGGNVWIGTQGGGLYRFNGSRIDASVTSMKDKFVRALERDSTGAMWAGSGKGLLRFTRPNGAPEEFETLNDSLFVSNLLALKNGQMAVATYGNGLILYDLNGALLKTFNSKNSPLSDRLFSLFEDHKNRLWIGSRSEGVFLLEGDSLIKFSDKSGFPETAPAIIQDEQKRIWIGISASGLQGFEYTDIENHMRGTLDRVVPISFNDADGLPVLSSNAGFSGQAFADTTGMLWFSTMKGLVGLNPPKSEAPKPMLYLQTLRINKEVVAKIPGMLSLSIDDRDLEIDYGTLNILSPKKVLFRYRMRGLTQNWTEAEKRRTAFFPSLPPGNYVFEVQSTDAFGRFRDAEQLIEIRVNPPVWMSPWFILAVILLFSIPVALFVRFISLRKLKKANEKLALERTIQQERERISRDLHDSVGSSITNLITGLEISHSMFDRRQGKKARAMLNTIENDAREAMHELRETIWLLDKKHIKIAELIHHVKSNVRRVEPYTGTMKLEVTEEIKAEKELSFAASLNCIRIIQEALNNARKYSTASIFSLHFEVSETHLSITITDNGLGFDVEKNKNTGNGLQNMELRAAQIGADYVLESEPGKGTSISLQIPFYPPKGM